MNWISSRMMIEPGHPAKLSMYHVEGHAVFSCLHVVNCFLSCLLLIERLPLQKGHASFFLSARTHMCGKELERLLYFRDLITRARAYEPVLTKRLRLTLLALQNQS